MQSDASLDAGPDTPDWQAILDASAIGLWEYDHRTGRARWNAQTSALLGRSEQDLPVGGDGWLGLLHPDDQAQVQRRLDAALRADIPFGDDGSDHWFRDDGNPRYDSRGAFIGYIGFCVDITEQKAAAEELERYRRHLEDLVEARTRELVIAKPIEPESLFAIILKWLERTAASPDSTSPFGASGACGISLTGHGPVS